VERLWANTKYFKEKMRELNFDLGQSVTPIVPVIVGDTSKAHALSKQLFEHGLFAMAITFPTVAKGKERLRVMMSATHSTEDLNFAVSAFEKAGRELAIIK
jgi:glycine C-acetyltransferase